MTAEERLDVIINTLLYMSGSGLCDDDRDILREVAEGVAHWQGDGWDICCPVCEEVTCDGGCPLAPLRDERFIVKDPS